MSEPRLERPAIERIIQRATELQAGERDIGDGLTEGELLQLARDVGIPDAYVRQAMLEERTKGALPDERGVVATIVGPRFVAAARALPGEAHRVETALHQWMADGELLAHTTASLFRQSLGFAVGAAGGVVIGLLAGVSRPVERFYEPLISLIYQRWGVVQV